MGAQWKARHKEIAANAKGNIFGKLSKEIMVAARGGADPDMNSRLRLVVAQAKKASMPRETLERAIKKGAGLLDGGANLERLVYEGFAPHRVPVIVECLSDNLNRTLSSMRVLFRKGQLGAAGSVSWDFNYQGMIAATPNSKEADAELAAIEAGAQDFELAEEGATLFITDATDLDAVCKALPAHGFTVQSAKLGYRPKNTVTLSDAEREEVETFLEALGQIRIKIIFTRKHRTRRDVRANRKTKLDGAFHCAFVQHWQHTGQRQIHRASLRIRFCAESGRSAGEDFALGRKLGMHFQPDDDFPSHK